MLELARAVAARPVRALSWLSTPRRATSDPADRETGLTRVLAVVAITVLGVAMAGALSLTGSATSSAAPEVEQSIAPDVRQPVEFSRQQGVSRSADRHALAQRGEANRNDADRVNQQQLQAALDQRAHQLAQEADDSAAAAEKLKENAVTQFPVQHYTLTGRWGDVGPWARYHTGLDMAAPVGTPISAPAAGVVTHAGPGGPAGTWAGCYLIIKHNDGKSSLYAHMNCAQQVTVGQHVAGGTPLGQVGLTGRTFGPHLHFELYPASATPGDIYSSEDPLPWLSASRH